MELQDYSLYPMYDILLRSYTRCTLGMWTNDTNERTKQTDGIYFTDDVVTDTDPRPMYSTVPVW